MVSYGTTDFKQWADNNGFNDNDLSLIRKKAKANMWLWFLLPALTFGIASFFAAPLLFNAYRVKAWIEQGTLEPRPTFIGTILYLILFVSFFGIIPLIVWLSIKDNGNLPGSGVSALLKKGKIGNHS